MTGNDLTRQGLSFKGSILTGLMGAGALIWQTTVQAWLFPSGYGPDLILLVIIYLGLFAPFTTAGAFSVFALGFLQDVATGGVFGLFSGIYLSVFLVAGLLHQNLNPTAFRYVIPFILAFIIGTRILTWLAFSLVDWPTPTIALSPSNPFVVFLVSAMITSFSSPLVFWVLDLIRHRANNRTEKET